MKLLICLTFAAGVFLRAEAASTIDAGNRYACGANIGWLVWRGDTANGAVIGEYVCSGYIYAANVGWINLGSGSPANQIQYQNNSASDFGVNCDTAGNLRGYAYGAGNGGGGQGGYLAELISKSLRVPGEAVLSINASGPGLLG